MYTQTDLQHDLTSVQNVWEGYVIEYYRTNPVLTQQDVFRLLSIPEGTSNPTILFPDYVFSHEPLDLIDLARETQRRIQQLNNLHDQLKHQSDEASRLTRLYISCYRDKRVHFDPLMIITNSAANSLIESWRHIIMISGEHDISKKGLSAFRTQQTRIPLMEQEETVSVQAMKNILDKLHLNVHTEEHIGNEYSDLYIYNPLTENETAPVVQDPNLADYLQSQEWVSCLLRINEHKHLMRSATQHTPMKDIMSPGIRTGIKAPFYAHLIQEEDYSPKDLHKASRIDIKHAPTLLKGLLHNGYTMNPDRSSLQLDLSPFSIGKYQCPAGRVPINKHELIEAGIYNQVTPLRYIADPNGIVMKTIATQFTRFMSYYQNEGACELNDLHIPNHVNELFNGETREHIIKRLRNKES